MLRKEIKRKSLMNLRKNLLNVRSDSNILYIYIYIYIYLRIVSQVGK